MLIVPQNSPITSNLAANLQIVRARIAAAADAAQRSVDSVTLVAVSKGHAAEMVRAVASSGVRDFGESYLQEAGAKMDELRALALTWHFIGRLQANKTRPIAEQFDWVHGVDRLKIAERLSEQRPHYAAPLQVCLQVNIGAEGAKAGIEPAEAASLAAAVRELPRLSLRGLMCILPADAEPRRQRALFHELWQLRAHLNELGSDLDTLSMGMSADYPEAILEGATLIRVGTAIFGAR